MTLGYLSSWDLRARTVRAYMHHSEGPLTPSLISRGWLVTERRQKERNAGRVRAVARMTSLAVFVEASGGDSVVKRQTSSPTTLLPASHARRFHANDPRRCALESRGS